MTLFEKKVAEMEKRVALLAFGASEAGKVRCQKWNYDSDDNTFWLNFWVSEVPQCETQYAEGKGVRVTYLTPYYCTEKFQVQVVVERNASLPIIKRRLKKLNRYQARRNSFSKLIAKAKNYREKFQAFQMKGEEDWQNFKPYYPDTFKF